MATFRFSLQKLLDMRIDKEEEAKLKLMEAQRLQMEAEANLNSLKEKYAKYNTIDTQLSVVEKKIKQNYMNALVNSINVAEEDCIKKSEMVDSCRNDLKAKQIERKTVELIKEKKYEDFRKEEDRKEQVQLDEFALYAYVRTTERG
ncbi:MAG: flagellar export protein FliJ [Clostridiales bacterium]|nr:flagellar export protein FliJ [Clostridiales bacterium]